ncbi:MAG: histidine kinase dimerization/phospho-acceptor domain-containing protein, partial [Leuconostoc lactis]
MKTFYLRQEAERHALEKLDAHLKSDLLQSVAHDLRTPLTGILASTALLRQ